MKTLWWVDPYGQQHRVYDVYNYFVSARLDNMFRRRASIEIRNMIATPRQVDNVDLDQLVVRTIKT